ncbi:MAG: Gfo/Idh/MocA family oxidoreductase [Clostridiales bacterium]|jgi:predicted dehydrogenase|nr:Gfo/Idh/MocA family oxidoreductase [Clostridiales bacterium]
MNKKMKVGVIGLGGMGRYTHVPALLELPEIEIAAICDIVESKFKPAEDLIGKPVAKYTDYNNLLDDNVVDAVHICTPNYLHSVIAVAALKKGAHVFCEKPDAVSVAEAEKMKAAADASGKVLMVMRNNRHVPASKYLKDKIENGDFGDLYCGRCGWTRRRGIPGKGGWFTSKSQSGGGPLIDLGVHLIDLSIYLMGNPRAVSVSGSVYNKFAECSDISDSEHSKFGEKVEGGTFDVEDLAIGFIKFENGASLQIEFSWASNIEEERAFSEIRGAKAGFTWENGKCRIFGEENGLLTNSAPIVSDAYGNGHAKNIRHFYDVIAKRSKPDYTIEQGINVIKILQAVYKSAELNREILL